MERAIGTLSNTIIQEARKNPKYSFQGTLSLRGVFETPFIKNI